MLNKELKFNAYERIGKKAGESYISIGKKGRFGFSSAFINKYFNRLPKYVYFTTSEDEYNLFFGFGFGNDENKSNKMKLIYPKSNCSNCIAGSSNIYEDFKKYLDKNAGIRQSPQIHDDEKFGKLYVINIQK